MATAADKSGVSTWENYLLQLINESREDAGVAPLAFDAELVRAAGKHSDWMVAQDVFSHTGANGSSASGRMTAEGYGWRAAGENIAYISGSGAATVDAADVERLHANLMNSAGHRANLLSANFEEIGIGITQGDFRGQPAIFVTENFGKPNTQEATETDGWFIAATEPTAPAAPAPSPTVTVADKSGVSTWENYLLQLINDSREDAGVKPLGFDAELVRAAGKHSDWMVAQDVFSHTGANGSSASGRMTTEGYGWRAAGENIAYISGTGAATVDAADVEQLHTNLMNSSGHRANLLSANFEEIGIGITQGDFRGRPAIFVTEDFGRPTAAEAAETDGWFI
jgi:uncharacterized protein YkwD